VTAEEKLEKIAAIYNTERKVHDLTVPRFDARRQWTKTTG
jgi:hypothetical protein